MSNLKYAAVGAICALALTTPAFAQSVRVDTLGVNRAILALAATSSMYDAPLVTESFVYGDVTDKVKFTHPQVSYEGDKIIFGNHVDPDVNKSAIRLYFPTRTDFINNVRLGGTYSLTFILAEEQPYLDDAVRISFSIDHGSGAGMSLTRANSGLWDISTVRSGYSTIYYDGISGLRGLRIRNTGDKLLFETSLDGENFEMIRSLPWNKIMLRESTYGPADFYFSLSDENLVTPNGMVFDEIRVEYERLAGTKVDEIAEAIANALIDEALAIPSPDVNRDGQTNAIDIQTVINKILGGN